MSLLIKNIGELFDGYKIIKNTSIYIENGKIKSIGREEKADEIIDASNKFVMPGFVDCHTHAIFSGYRAFEIEWKIEGLSYKEIAERGGGIAYTVEQTRKASKEKLKKETMERVKEMIKHGTTTAEIKSGYGLDTENEIKMLEVINEIKNNASIDIVPTFLAHAVPKDMKADDFVDVIVEEMLPEIGERKLAKFCDVFCEVGYFNVEQSRKILMEAKKYGMLPKIHADEFSCMGCSKLAAELEAASADHLLMTSEKEMELLADAGVVATLLPATPF
ncbi:MAG: imidazolonepropionase, partial [Thermoplasmata archaeon]